MAVGARIDAAVEMIGRLFGFPRWPAWLRLSFYRAMQVVAVLLSGVGGAAIAAKAFLLAAAALTVAFTLFIGASIAIGRHRGGRPDRHPVFDRLPRPIQVAWSYAYLIVGRALLNALTRSPLGVFLALFGASVSQEGAAFHRRMRRLRTPRARTLTSVDGRRTVLYLRTFAADEIGTGDFFDAPLTTDEEHIAAALAGIGPLVAIGRPSEPLPELGAARAYFADDEWQTAIRSALGEATLVVVRAGSTEHLFWEFALARELRAPSTLIVLVPNDTREYDAFAARCAERGIVLPPGPPAERFFAPSVGGVRGFVSFGDDWQPRYMPFDAWHRTALNVRLGRLRTANAAYHIGFSPVYGRLDLPWTPLAVSPAVVLLYTVIAIYAVVLFWLVFIR